MVKLQTKNISTSGGSTESPIVTAVPKRGNQWRSLLSKYGTVAALVVLVAYFSFTAPNFLTAQNIKSIALAVAVVGMISAGLTITLIMQDFDLSIGYIATVSGMLAAGIAQYYGSLYAWIGAVLFGVGIGLANGLITTKLRVSAFIATLAIGQILQGFLYFYNDGASISYGLPSDFANLGSGSVGPVPILVLFWLGMSFLFWLMLEHTSLGRRMYASGGNPKAAQLTGIRVERLHIIGFTTSGAACGLAGFLLASNLGVGNNTAGLGYLLPAFAACFIGAATLREGQFHMGGTLLGVLILGVLANGLVLRGVSPAWTTAAQGLVLIVAVSASQILRRKA